MKNYKLILSLLRVKQWVKNLFIFFPLMFAGYILYIDKLQASLMAFSSFCFISSAFYIINDLVDYKKDRLHPEKGKRPLASGLISRTKAAFLSGILLLIGFAISFILGNSFVFIAAIYMLLQILYNLGVKKVVIWDVLFIAFGFILRVWAGAEAVGVVVSFWLLICVFVLALFLGFVKRRNEMNILRVNSNLHRDVLRHYSVYLLDQFILLTATLSIVFYSLYTISPDVVSRVKGYKMVPSVVFVIYGLLRYLYLAHILKRGGDPAEILLKDKTILLAVLCWASFVFYLLYC